MDVLLDLELLLLLVTANSVPIAAKRFFGETANRALDGGARWRSHPLFGPSKTIRGIAFSLVATPVVALALGLPASVGLIVASGTVVPGVASTKRTGIAPRNSELGERAVG